MKAVRNESFLSAPSDSLQVSGFPLGDRDVDSASHISRLFVPIYSGYFMVRRSVIAGKLINPLGYKTLIEVLCRGDIERIAEAGYIFQVHEEGESKVTRNQYKEYIHHLLRLRFSTGRLEQIRQRIDFPISRFIRFILVGFTGLAVDMGSLYQLYDVLGLGLARSAILASSAARMAPISSGTIFGLLETFQSISGNGVRGVT